MQFSYKAITNTGEHKDGIVNAGSHDLAVAALQRRGLIVVSVQTESESKPFFSRSIFNHVPQKDVVILSRQISTLFEAQVSAMKSFSLLAAESENPMLRTALTEVVDDLQSGLTISAALAKHPDIFTNFYVNMIKAGEESGKLSQTFIYLADYLDRQYSLVSKTRNALIYPVFVVVTFFAVMSLMFVFVIPKLSAIIVDSGQVIPLYTKVVIGLSDFFVHYGIFVLIALVVFGMYMWRLSKTKSGRQYLDSIKLSLPGFGLLFRKLYLSRIADNLETMITAGISIVRAIEITADVVGNEAYAEVMRDTEEMVKTGSALSDGFGRHELIPQIMVQMTKVGEETGSLGSILKTLAHFYKREVDDAVDTLVGLIEPIMIVVLGVMVGVLLTSVLLPIYNIASGIG